MGAIHDQELLLAGANDLGYNQRGKHRRRNSTTKKTLETAIVTIDLGVTRKATREFSHVDQTHLNQRTHQTTDQVDTVAREGYRPLREGFL